MKEILPFILIIAIAGATLFIYTYYRFRASLHRHARRPQDLSIPDGWNLITEFATNKQGQQIAYWCKKAPDAKAAIILVHGHSNPGGKYYMLCHARYLYAAGYSVCMLDLHSYDESEGDFTTLGRTEWQDIEAVFDRIKSYSENTSTKVGLLGVSMGAVSAINMVGKTGKGDFLIASAPYKSLSSLFHTQIRREKLTEFVFYPLLKLAAFLEFGRNYDATSPERLIPKISVPTLLFSASQDEEVPTEDAHYLFDHSPALRKQLVELPGPHDIFDHHPEEFKQAVLQFLSNL